MNFDQLIQWAAILLIIVISIGAYFSLRYLKKQSLTSIQQKTSPSSIDFWLLLALSIYCAFSFIGGWLFLPFSQFFTFTLWGFLLFIVVTGLMFLIVLSAVLKVDDLISCKTVVSSTSFTDAEISAFHTKFLYIGLLGLLIYWFLLFPGVLSVDSLVAWDELKTLNYTTQHSFTYTYLQKILTYLWDTPAIISLVQVILYVFLISLWIKILLQYKVRKDILWIGGLYILLSPANAVMINTLWKDTPYLFSHLMSMYYSFQIINNNNSYTKNSFLLGIFITLPLAFRHNGIAPLFVYLAVFFILAIIHKKLRYYYYLIGGSILTYCIIFIGLVNIINVQNTTSIRNMSAPVIMPINTAYIYNQEQTLPKNIRVLSEKLDAKEWKSKGSVFINEIDWRVDNFSEIISFNSSQEVLSYYLQLWQHNPGLQLRTRLNLINPAWNALSIPLFEGVNTRYQQVLFPRDSFIKQALTIVFVTSIMLQPLWLATIIILFFSFYIFFYGDKRKLILLIPWISDLACLFLISPSTDYRYFWISIFTAFILSILTFLPIPNSEI